MKKRMSFAVAAAAVAAMAMADQAAAVVPTCDALSLYANAAQEGLCKSLSPTTQNLWVCELAGSPDIHLTFNVGTNLHITVREHQLGCQGNAQFNGTFGAAPALTLATVAPICGVNIVNYRGRLNAVGQMNAAPGQTLVQTAVLSAVARRRLTVQVAQTYINMAAARHCP